MKPKITKIMLKHFFKRRMKKTILKEIDRFQDLDPSIAKIVDDNFWELV